MAPLHADPHLPLSDSPGGGREASRAVLLPPSPPRGPIQLQSGLPQPSPSLPQSPLSGPASPAHWLSGHETFRNCQPHRPVRLPREPPQENLSSFLGPVSPSRSGPFHPVLCSGSTKFGHLAPNSRHLTGDGVQTSRACPVPSTLQLTADHCLPHCPRNQGESPESRGPRLCSHLHLHPQASVFPAVSPPPGLPLRLCVCEEVAMNSCLCSFRGAPGGSAGASTRASLRLGLSAGLFVPEGRRAPLYLWCVIQCLAESQPESVHGRETLIQAGQGSERAAALLGASGAGDRVQRPGASGGRGPLPGEERVRSGFAFLSIELRYPKWFEFAHLGIKTVSSLVLKNYFLKR